MVLGGYPDGSSSLHNDDDDDDVDGDDGNDDIYPKTIVTIATIDMFILYLP